MEENRKEIRIMELREMMKTAYDEFQPDQQEGLPQPPLEKEWMGGKVIPLARNFKEVVKNNDYLELINTRTSRRRYSGDPLSKDELAFLLWATQGVKEVNAVRTRTMRTVPSAGARHPFETYLFVNRVEGLEKGLYHYLAIEHKLEFIGPVENQTDRLSEAFGGQTFFAGAAVAFVWTVVPYRSEWRYATVAQKYALIDVGHVCQNLYLACGAIGCGTCAIGAYEQSLADRLLGLDPAPSFAKENEFVVYAAAVGRQE